MLKIKESKFSKCNFGLKKLKQSIFNRAKKIKTFFDKKPVLKRNVLKIVRVSVVLIIAFYISPKVARAIEPVGKEITSAQEHFLERNIEARKLALAEGNIRNLRNGTTAIRPRAIETHINRLYPTAFLAKRMLEYWKLTEMPVLSPLTRGAFIVTLASTGGYIGYRVFKAYKDSQS